MSSPPPPPPATSSSSLGSMNNSNSNNKKPMRELNSITNHLLLSKTLNALATNSSAAPAPSTSSIKENIPNDPASIAQQKALNLRLAAALKPTDRDNVAALLQFYQTLNQQQNPSPIHQSSPLTNSSVSKSQSKKPTSMTYLCRFHQRNRLIEVPPSSEFYNGTHGITHEHLKQLIMQEFQLQKTPVIIQLWNEQYQEYIDIESFKKIPFEGRLQVLIEKSLPSINNSPSIRSKSPTTPISSTHHHHQPGTARSISPTPFQSTPSDQNHDEDLPAASKSINYEEAVSTVSPMENLSHGPMYDLLPKPVDGIPIPRFPPHIAAFLNGNGDANQLNALVQALYQEIVKYELYPNADELRSIVTRLVERHPNSITVIGSIELLVRKLYYKFCNERKKYPVELKRRQPNKRKRLIREDDGTPLATPSLNATGKLPTLTNDLDRFMHLWTNTTNPAELRLQPHHDGDASPNHSPSGSSPSPSSSPDLHQHAIKLEKFCPLNLSMGNNNPMASE